MFLHGDPFSVLLTITDYHAYPTQLIVLPFILFQRYMSELACHQLPVVEMRNSRTDSISFIASASAEVLPRFVVRISCVFKS